MVLSNGYLTTAEVAAGAKIAGGSNATVLTTDNTYDDIAAGTTNALPAASTADLTIIVNAVNSALAANAYDFGGFEGGVSDTMTDGARLMVDGPEAVAVSVSSSNKISNALVVGITKGESGAGLPTSFAVKAGTTLSAVTISDPISGDSYSLNKRELIKVNAKVAFAPNRNGISTFSITGSDYDGNSGLAGRKKTITIIQGASAYASGG